MSYVQQAKQFPPTKLTHRFSQRNWGQHRLQTFTKHDGKLSSYYSRRGATKLQLPASRNCASGLPLQYVEDARNVRSHVNALLTGRIPVQAFATQLISIRTFSANSRPESCCVKAEETAGTAIAEEEDDDEQEEQNKAQ